MSLVFQNASDYTNGMMNQLQAAEKRYANLKFLWEKEREINAALVEALKAVEWIPAVTRDYCPWCRNWRTPGQGHSNACKRQQALALVEGDE